MDTGQSDFTDPPSTVKYVIGSPVAISELWQRDRRAWTRDLNRGRALGGKKKA